MFNAMSLKILLPFQVFSENTQVLKIIAESTQGSFGLLPNRLDCVATLVPGILCYQVSGETEVYVAIDEGVLVKTGSEVLISVRNAIAGAELSMLRATVRQEFLNRDVQEQHVRSVLAKLETGFVRRFMEFRHD
jgi:F-type H+-transporting ATPase subunit epsilon